MVKNDIEIVLKEIFEKTNLKEGDLERRTDFEGVDFALVTLTNPKAISGYIANKVNLDPEKGELDNGYYPISLQYRLS